VINFDHENNRKHLYFLRINFDHFRMDFDHHFVRNQQNSKKNKSKIKWKIKTNATKKHAVIK